VDGGGEGGSSITAVGGRIGNDSLTFLETFFRTPFFCWFVRMVHLNFDRTAILTRVGSVSMHGLASGQLQAAKHEEELARQANSSREIWLVATAAGVGTYTQANILQSDSHRPGPPLTLAVRSGHLSSGASTQQGLRLFLWQNKGAMCRCHEIFVANLYI
jgi:hypothetical protein